MQQNTHSNIQTSLQKESASPQNDIDLNLETQDLLQVAGGKSAVSTDVEKGLIRFVNPPSISR